MMSLLSDPSIGAALIALSGIFLGLTTLLFTEVLSRRRARAERRLFELVAQSAAHSGGEPGVSSEVRVDADPVGEAMRKQQERLAALTALGDSYHEQALGQARVQFRVSTVAASIGFLLIIYGGFMQIASSPVTVAEVALGTLPGAVIEAVAALFFAQAASTRQRATDFYSRLQDDQRTRQALEIADGIAEPNLKAMVYAQMALHTSGLKTTELDIQSALGGASAEAIKAEVKE